MVRTCAASPSSAALGQPNSYATPREIRCSTSTSTSPATLSHHACKMGLEGIVSKRRGSRYRSGRSKDWLKMKNSDAPAVKREAEEEWGR
jgi:ATP-dependent DNA ligase